MRVSKIVLGLLLLPGAICAVSGEEVARQSYLLAEAGRHPGVEKAALALYPQYSREMVENAGRPARYIYNQIDLDDDGTDEVVVYLLGPFFCGTGGCNLLVLGESDEGLMVINNLPTTRVPLVVRDDVTAGWRDLVRFTSGGGMEPAFHLLQFDGKQYVETGPVAPEAAFDGLAILADDLTSDSGIPLEPTR